MHRREGFRSSKIMLERAQANPKIEWLLNKTVSDIHAGDDGKLEFSKESELDSALEVFDIKPNTFNTLPALKYSSERTVDGESKYSQQGRFETTITAVVIDVKPNGALLIEGYRTLEIDGDYKRMHIRGLVRTVDIGSDNTVSSDKVANGDVRYDAKGPRSRASEKNWFERLMDVIWPF